MTEITSTRLIDCPPRTAYSCARQVQRFPDVLPDLDSVEVLSDDGNGNIRTSWVGTINVGPLSRQIAWVEDDQWLDDELTCSFKLVEGDMKTYDGSWQFLERDGKCEVRLTVNFELGVPVLGPMVNRIVDQLMQKNCDQLLEALEKLSREG